MLARLKKLVRGSGARASRRTAHAFDELSIAAVALLVEVAMVDSHFDEAERDRIIALARDRFVDGAETARALVAEAEKQVSASTQLYSFTTSVKNGFSHDERVHLMQILWEVVLADGKTDPFEDQLMRRLGSLIAVSDRDRAITRQRARTVHEPG